MAKGTRGGKRISEGAKTSKQIADKWISKALESKMKGVQRMAREGTGNYAFKNATPISASQTANMSVIKVTEKNGDTLIEGILNNKNVYYANKSTDGTINKIKSREQTKKAKQVQEMKTNMEKGLNMTPTSTYDRWKKRNDAKIKAWFGSDRI